MTLESSISKNVYTGNGSTTVFPFVFHVWETSQVQVLVGSDEEETDVTASVAIALSDTGGTVTFSTAPEAGVKVAIIRQMPFLQLDEYITGTRFDPHEIEDALDIACAERQELREKIDRAVSMPATSEKTHDEYIAEFWAAVRAVIAAKDEFLENILILRQFYTGIPIIKETIEDITEELADGLYAVGGYAEAGSGSADISSRMAKAATGTELRSLASWFEELATLARSQVSGVKGNVESTYRAGLVNLTPANLGAAQASHTHSTSDITSGSFDDARIPNLAASKITSGTFDTARIPNLSASKITSGTIDIARLPAGALERLFVVSDQTARYALTTSQVQNGDVVKQADTGLLYFVKDDSQLGNANGYEVFTAGAATSVAWSGIIDRPTTYPPSTHTHAAGDISSGTLPVEKGGTGSSTKNFVDLTSNQDVDGQKTFLNHVVIQKSDDPRFVLKATTNPGISVPSSTVATGSIRAGANDGSLKGGGYVSWAAIGGTDAAAGDTRLSLSSYATSSTAKAEVVLIASDNGNVFQPNGTTNLGASSKKWSYAYINQVDAHICRDVDTSFVEVSAGLHGAGTSAFVAVYGENYTGSSALKGTVCLDAAKGSDFAEMRLNPTGTATWNGQTIQTTSDERLKTPLSDVPDNVLDAWGKVNWGQFKFLADVTRKGDEARLHTGLIAQAVKRVFEADGLDACEYGILCHEEHAAHDAIYDAEGNLIEKAEEAVDLWMIRYEEAQAMEAAYQRRRAEKAEARIAVLEEQMVELRAMFLELLNQR